MAKVRYIVQVLVDEDRLSDAQEVIGAIDNLFNEGEIGAEVISAEIDTNQETSTTC